MVEAGQRSKSCVVVHRHEPNDLSEVGHCLISVMVASIYSPYTPGNEHCEAVSDAGYVLVTIK